MQGLEAHLVTFLTNLFHTIGWFGVIVIMILESANIPIPSEVTMPLAGWLLVQDRGLSALHAFWMGGLFGAIGCTVGSLLSYGLGAWGGRPLVERYGKYILVSEDDLERADHWFARWGDWAVFISRLLPIVRTFISFPAGMVHVKVVRFTVLSFVGSFIWCAFLAWGGWHFGQHWEQLRSAMRPFDIPILVIIGLAVVWYIVHHIRRSKENGKPDTEGVQ